MIHHTQCAHCGESYEVVADHKHISKFCCADASHYDDDYRDEDSRYDEDVIVYFDYRLAEYFVDYDEQDYYDYNHPDGDAFVEEDWMDFLTSEVEPQASDFSSALLHSLTHKQTHTNTNTQ